MFKDIKAAAQVSQSGLSSNTYKLGRSTSGTGVQIIPHLPLKTAFRVRRIFVQCARRAYVHRFFRPQHV
ncbi:hypothetical protein Mapa_006056 [Marchantia paleacea]|nr:hypothetical protein Mapa_006056 [Marchantia paleacea]